MMLLENSKALTKTDQKMGTQLYLLLCSSKQIATFNSDKKLLNFMNHRPMSWLNQNEHHILDIEKNKRLIIVLGFGLAEHVYQILDRVSSKAQILIIEPFPEILNQVLSHQNYSDLLYHPQVQLFIGSLQELQNKIRSYSKEIRALDKTAIFFHQPTWSLVKKQKNAIYPGIKKLRDDIQAEERYSTQKGRMKAIKTLYFKTDQKLKAAQQIYTSLSCQSGCANCCTTSGSSMLLTPLEWELLYSQIQKLPMPDRRLLFWSVLLHTRKYLNEIVQFQKIINAHPIPQNSDSAHFELFFELHNKISLNQCPLLNEHNQCKVYESRPMICRIYGYGYWESSNKTYINQKDATKIPYTCSMDKQNLKSLLVNNQTKELFNAEKQFQKMSFLHRPGTSKPTLLSIWLAFHLDIEQSDFLLKPYIHIQDLVPLIQKNKVEELEKNIEDFIATHQVQYQQFIEKRQTHHMDSNKIYLAPPGETQ